MIELFREIILQNELGGNRDLIYCFSDPDGVRTGRSGWSFGVCQFDVANNPDAILCLRACGFTTDEILGLKNQTLEIGPLNNKLRAVCAIVNYWDTRQLRGCLYHPLNLCREYGISLGDRACVYHLADYNNQFYMSRGGKMHNFLKKLGRPVVIGDILKLKMSTRWGKKRPDDIHRRFDNIVRLTA